MSGTFTEVEIAGAAGDESADLPTIRGWLDAIHYERDDTNGYTAGATLKVELMPPEGFPGEEIAASLPLSADATWRPRVPAQDGSGADIAGSYLAVLLALSRLRLTVTGGGAGNTGKFLVTFKRD